MKKFSKYIVLGIATLLSVIMCAAVIWLANIVQEVDNVKLEIALLDQTTFIYAEDPVTKKEFVYDSIYAEENRIWIEYDKIPENMINAFVAVEDQRFFSHHGFDFKRLIGAMTNFVSEGNSSYGASTITQQLIKNISGDEDVNVKRKLREIYRAMKIEQQYTKEEIMEFYLNTIYLSNQCNGVEAAAQRYFGKSVNKLSLAQMASIAGITQFPTKYDPIANPVANKQKQEIVLSKMLQLGFIDEAEYNKARSEKLVFSKIKKTSEIPRAKRYFSDAVIVDVLEDLQEKAGYPEQIALKMLYSGGLKIKASVNPEIQDIVEKVYSDPENFPERDEKILQSAIVVVDPKTGNIVGMSGGFGDEGRMTLNRATQTFRQPGSSIKPISVYGPALELGVININSTVVDEPIKIGNWAPKNSGGGFSGTVSLRSAVARSLNIPAIKVLQSLGIDNSFNHLKDKLHITSLVEEKKSGDIVVSDKSLAPLALGGLTEGITVEQLAAAYVPFANGGTYYKPSTYYTVEDFNGNIILDHKNEGEAVYTETTSYTMTTLLQGVTSYGTGTGANLGKMPTAGKTGTTDSDKDKWFVGYTPYYLAAVWTGYDIPKPIYGGNRSVTMWKKVMSEVHEKLEPKKFNEPDPNKEEVKVCSLSGKLASDVCALDIRGSKIVYKDKKDVKSEEKCDIHKKYTICGESGKLATGNCPKRVIGALGYADDTHKEKDGYIKKEYCGIYHPRINERKVSVCVDSGLRAGPGCVNVKSVKASSAPAGTCGMNHANNNSPEIIGGNPPVSTPVPGGTTPQKTSKPVSTSPISTQPPLQGGDKLPPAKTEAPAPPVSTQPPAPPVSTQPPVAPPPAPEPEPVAPDPQPPAPVSNDTNEAMTVVGDESIG